MEILVGVNYNSVYFVRNSELSDFLEDVMLKNYIKIALRNMFRSKLYSFINLRPGYRFGSLSDDMALGTG